MKPITFLVCILSLLGLSCCSSKEKATLGPTAVKNIAVLTMDGNIPDKTAEQARELRITLEWMDHDLINTFNGSGLHTILLKERQDYNPEMGNLLIVDVERFNAGSRAARAFVGFGAGSASLDLNYKLFDDKGALLSEWRDDVGSSKGAAYCAETLNKKALEKVVTLLNR